MEAWLDDAQLQARPVRLKDGREAVVRPVCVKDAPGVLALEIAVHRAGVGTVQTLAEVDDTVEEMRASLEKAVVTEKTVAVACTYVAEAAGEIAGSVEIKRARPERLRHVARVSIGVHPAWQGLGIGRALMDAALAWAWDGPGRRCGGVHRIELGVLANNARALKLYESLGFQREGVRRDFVRMEDGTYVDDVSMALLGGATKNRPAP